MAKFQLWKRDEYGQGSIVVPSGTIEELFAKAKAEVTDVNVNNALTGDDRERNWEAYFPVVSSKKKSKNMIFFYGGNGSLNRAIFYAMNEKTGEVKEVEKEDISDLDIKIYLGNISATKKVVKEWFAEDTRKKLVTSMSYSELASKTMFFIKVVKQ